MLEIYSDINSHLCLQMKFISLLLFSLAVVRSLGQVENKSTVISNNVANTNKHPRALVLNGKDELGDSSIEPRAIDLDAIVERHDSGIQVEQGLKANASELVRTFFQNMF